MKSVELAEDQGQSLRECLYFKEEECKKLVRERGRILLILLPLVLEALREEFEEGKCSQW